jgi:recombination protein RecR
MFADLPTFQRLIRQLQRVPFLASKNVYKVAVYFLMCDKKNIEQLCQTLIDVKTSIKFCKECFNMTEKTEDNDALCSICASAKRDKQVICVVETLHDLFAIENSGGFNGVYHVLGGALCPLEGVGPDNLTVDSLVKRLRANKVNELIFATNPTPEGEATASYIFSKIKDLSLPISRLASGVPIGSNLEYMDRVTISKALTCRRPF